MNTSLKMVLILGGALGLTACAGSFPTPNSKDHNTNATAATVTVVSQTATTEPDVSVLPAPAPMLQPKTPKPFHFRDPMVNEHFRDLGHMHFQHFDHVKQAAHQPQNGFNDHFKGNQAPKGMTEKFGHYAHTHFGGQHNSADNHNGFGHNHAHRGGMNHGNHGAPQGSAPSHGGHSNGCGCSSSSSSSSSSTKY